ncbi:MAG TPA: NADH-quinone oxidoreductase subunit J [Noviherbaspirillum sp.]
MTAFDIAQIVAFTLCAFIAVAGALGMATTMSMFRSGIFLMASFLGVAGLFILLAADLMGLLQIMMYIGGMLVMILFMVLFMHDPGGAMMAAMPGMMAPVERFFSGGLQQGEGRNGDHADMHAGNGEAKEADRENRQNGANGEHHAQHDGMQHGGSDMSMNMEGTHMDDMDMSMVTPVRRIAAWLAVAIGVGLGALVLLRPSWPTVTRHPDPRSAEAVGMLLMGKYMIAFEGAGFLILLGIVGAVLMARVERHPDNGGRDARVGRTDAPPQIAPDPVIPPSPDERPNEEHASEHHAVAHPPSHRRPA